MRSDCRPRTTLKRGFGSDDGRADVGRRMAGRIVSFFVGPLELRARRSIALPIRRDFRSPSVRVAVIEKCSQPWDELIAPERGTEWRPFLDWAPTEPVRRHGT